MTLLHIRSDRLLEFTRAIRVPRVTVQLRVDESSGSVSLVLGVWVDPPCFSKSVGDLCVRTTGDGDNSDGEWRMIRAPINARFPEMLVSGAYGGRAHIPAGEYNAMAIWKLVDSADDIPDWDDM